MQLETLLRGLPLLNIQGPTNLDITAAQSSYSLDLDTAGPLPKDNTIIYTHFGPLLSDKPEYYFGHNIKALVTDRAVNPPPGVTVIRVLNTFETHGLLCSRLAGNPSKDLTLIGVTGTNGKTTTVELINAVLCQAGLKTAVFGTLNYRINDEIIMEGNDPDHFTTPPPEQFQNLLVNAKSKGVTHVVMEISSQGLMEHRISGSEFNLGVFTNCSAEHLDYHLSFEDYFNAKASFFRYHLARSQKKNRSACFNTMTPRLRKLAQEISPLYTTLGFGRRPGNLKNVYCRKSRVHSEGIECEFVTPKGSLSVESPLLGSFNLSNLLAALSAGLALDINLQTISDGLGALKSVRGRMQRIPNDFGLEIYFDWAHTVESFRRVLQTLRNWKKKGKVHTFFGCENSMDSQKRLETARAAARYSDFLYITLENLNRQACQKVKAEMEPGLKEFQTPYEWFEKGEDATSACIKRAEPGDTVAVLGWQLEILDWAENWLKEAYKRLKNQDS